MSSTYFGLNLLLKIIEKDVKSEADIVIAFTHWFLTKNSGLRCIGNGEDRSVIPNECGDEILPTGWNDNDKYALRYIFNNEIYILLGTVTEQTIIVNLLNVKTQDVSNAAFHLQNTVKQLTGNCTQIMPDLATFTNRLTKELLEPVFTDDKKTIETQTTPDAGSSPASTANPRFLSDFSNILCPPHGTGNTNPLRDLGRSDLDPFGAYGGGGSGMLFNPNDPRNRRPHGPRFDPLNPVNPNFGRPRNDHFRPPDFDDNMFM